MLAICARVSYNDIVNNRAGLGGNMSLFDIAARRVCARALIICLFALALAPGVAPRARAGDLRHTSVTQVQAGAFQGDTSLEQMRLPATLTAIGDYAFAGCTALKEIYIYSPVTDIAETAFEGVPELTIWCLIGSDACEYARAHGIAYEYINAMQLACDAEDEIYVLTPVTWSISDILPGVAGDKRVDVTLYHNGTRAGGLSTVGACEYAFTPVQPGEYYVSVTVSAGNESASRLSPAIMCVGAITLKCDTALNGAAGLPVTWTISCDAFDVRGQAFTYDYKLYRGAELADTLSGSADNTYAYTPAQAGDYRLEATLSARGARMPLISDTVPVAAALYIGLFEQDNDPSAPEPLQWRVLSVDGGKALVITEYVIRNASFFNPSWIKFKYCYWQGSYIGTVASNIWYKTGEKMYVSPEKIPLADKQSYGNDAYLSERYHARYWLNGEFYNEAFSNAERARIALTTNKTADYVSGSTVVEGGPDTQDHVFFLSVEEQRQYLPTKAARYVKPTAAARSQGVGMGKGGEAEYCEWWLRSPGQYRVNSMCNVFYSGGLVLAGNDVGHKAGYRPAMWITIGG